jgi:NADPH-dependent dioxygenase
MPNISQTEVLVVGAGPVGMLTALLLIQHGVRTQIIDQESRTAAHSYACALHPASLCLLERAGIADKAIELGGRIKIMSVYEGPVPRIRLKLSDLPGRYPFAVVLEQSALEDLLEQKLRSAGCRVKWNHRLLQIKPVDNGVDACIENLACSRRDDSVSKGETISEDRVTIHVGFVVGANGHNSTLRQQLDIRSVRAGAPQLFAIFEFETFEPVDNKMRLVLDESAVSVLWPLAKNKCRWSFQIVFPEDDDVFPPKDRERPMSVGAHGELGGIDYLRDFLVERAPWFPAEGVREMNWIAHVLFQQQLATKYGQGRCWLAGDAAHQTSPTGMQSMSIGLLEEAKLADRIASILRGKAELEVLQAYDRVHRTGWIRLLGLKKPSEPPNPIASWARRHYGTILRSLLASGGDLNHLLKQL